MRNISVELAAELAQTTTSPVLLAEMYFDSGTLRMWTGYGDLVWNGATFTGGGNFIGVSAIEETQDTVAKGIVVSLNGVPTELIAVALLEKTRNRPFRLYLGVVNVSGRIELEAEDGFARLEDGSGYIILESDFFADPYRIFSGLMDVIEIIDSGDSCTIRLSVESILITGQRNKISRYTDSDQVKTYPSDKGFNLINQLQDKSLVW